MTTIKGVPSLPRPSSMRGMSFLGWLVVIALVVIFGSAGMRIIPAYLEYNTVRTVIGSVLSDKQLPMMSEREVRDGIRKRFSVNTVDSISADDIFIEKSARSVVIGVDYEVRGTLFGNIDMVVRFDRQFEEDISR